MYSPIVGLLNIIESLYSIIDQVLFFIIAALLLWQSLTSTKELSSDLSELDKKKQLKDKRNKIWWISASIFVMTILQYQNSEYQKARSANKLKLEQDSRDSIIMKNTELNTDTLFSKLSRALKKEGYKLDTIQGKLHRLQAGETINPYVMDIRNEINSMRYPLDRLNVDIIFKKSGLKSDLTMTTVRIYILDSSSEKLTKEIYSLINLDAYEIAKNGIKSEHLGLESSFIITEKDIFETGENYIIKKEGFLSGFLTSSPNNKIKSFKDLASAGIIMTVWPKDNTQVPQIITFKIITKDNKYNQHFAYLQNPKFSHPLYIYRGFIKPSQVETALSEF